MDDRQERALRKAVRPISNIIRKSHEDALILRVKVHLLLAKQNGAEPEDFGEFVAMALESAVPITKKYLDELAELEKAKLLKGEIS